MEQFDAFKAAIQAFPEYLFVWKMNSGDPKIAQVNEEVDNVHATEWVEQTAILGLFLWNISSFKF